MLSVLKIETKRLGVNVFLLTAAALIIFTILCMTGGDLINWPLLGFEVLCPILVAILVCEWVQTLSDPIIDIIVVHSKSMFTWVVGRYIIVVGISSMLCVLCMAGLRLFVMGFPLAEMIFVYATTSVFFTSIGVFISFLSRQPHVPVSICGTIWLLSLMIKSLVRFPAVALFYPMLRFADADMSMWVVSKLVLLTISLCMWVAVYAMCIKRKFA